MTEPTVSFDHFAAEVACRLDAGGYNDSLTHGERHAVFGFFARRNTAVDAALYIGEQRDKGNIIIWSAPRAKSL